MNTLQKGYMAFLFATSIVFLAWGLAGIFEYLTGITPVIHLQSNYTPALQFLHWLLILLFGAVFSTSLPMRD